MKIHILGICGTFMAGVAILAKQTGHQVSGSDERLLPPMSTQLYHEKMNLYEGYTAENMIQSSPDLVVIGNVIKRGNPALEYVLSHKIPYLSGPEWLYREVLSKQKKVLAVAGTHGKTTTTSILTWILEKTDHNPGFLIGGVPENFGFSARLGAGDYFVIEADEYDTAFFDKRSKFVHYHPDIVIINNLEYDHADIFPDLSAIQKQFHQMIRMLPEEAVIIRPLESTAIDDTLKMGCWSQVKTFSMDKSCASDWQAELIKSDGTHFCLKYREANQTHTMNVDWHLLGTHNVSNAMAAIAATHALKLPLSGMCEALKTFKNVKRRLEIKGKVNDVTVYDDFAHHPTAIEATIHALRQHVGQAVRIIAILHLASNSMRMGIYKERLGSALKEADEIYVLKPQNLEALNWVEFTEKTVNILDSIDELVQNIVKIIKPQDHILVMSNGNFEGIHDKILTALKN